jgi:hypothetical protein
VLLGIAGSRAEDREPQRWLRRTTLALRALEVREPFFER